MKWYAFVLLGCFFSGGMLFYSSRSAAPPSIVSPQRFDSSRPTPESVVRIEEAHVLEQTDTARTWELFMGEGTLHTTTQLVIGGPVHARLLGQTASALQVMADHGQFNRTTGDITLQGNVQLQAAPGYTVETENLRWQAARRVLHTDAAVRIHHASVAIVGTGLLGDIDRQRFVLQGDVRASFR